MAARVLSRDPASMLKELEKISISSGGQVENKAKGGAA